MLVMSSRKFLNRLKAIKPRNAEIKKFNSGYPKYREKTVEELKALPFEELGEIIYFAQAFGDAEVDFFWDRAANFGCRLKNVPQPISKKRLF